jgi:hypothetical protein
LEIGSHGLFARLALNHGPTDLRLRYEPLASGLFFFKLTNKTVFLLMVFTTV